MSGGMVRNGCRWCLVAWMVLGLALGPGVAPAAGQGQAQPGGEQVDRFLVDAGTSTTPVDVGDGLRICVATEGDLTDDDMHYTWNNTPLNRTSGATADFDGEVRLVVDSEECINIVSCQPATVPDVNNPDMEIVSRDCERAEDQNRVLRPDTVSGQYEALDACFCVNTTGRLTVWFDLAGDIGDQDHAWMNLTVRENQALYDEWRMQGTAGENGSTEASVSFQEGGLPFFSNLESFAVPLFWLGGAVVLFVSGWLVSGTYFVVGLVGHFADTAWVSDEVLIVLAGMFLLAEMAANMTNLFREKVSGLLGIGGRS